MSFYFLLRRLSFLSISLSLSLSPFPPPYLFIISIPSPPLVTISVFRTYYHSPVSIPIPFQAMVLSCSLPSLRLKVWDIMKYRPEPPLPPLTIIWRGKCVCKHTHQYSQTDRHTHARTDSLTDTHTENKIMAQHVHPLRQIQLQSERKHETNTHIYIYKCTHIYARTNQYSVNDTKVRVKIENWSLMTDW